MLISDTHEFIFVHNYKVAGSSIKSALASYATAPRRYAGWVRRQLDQIGLWEITDYPQHLKASEIKEREPSRWEQYFTFGFVRNPWSWQVSLYFFMLQNEGHQSHEKVKEMDGFEEYIEWRVREKLVLQSSFFCDEKGKFIVDFVGRLENIQEEFQHLCERIGVDAKLPHKNKSSHKNYREYYNEYTRNLVADHFSKDIKKFDYTFEGPIGKRQTLDV